MTKKLISWDDAAGSLPDVVQAGMDAITDGKILVEHDLERAHQMNTFATDGEVRSQVKTDGTDQTAALLAELTALNAAGGGTLVLPIGTVTLAGTLTLPNNGAAVPIMAPLRLRGQGGQWATRGTSAPIGGTILDIKGTDTYGKIKTNGVGVFSAEGITFTDSAGTTTPFIYTTNTTLLIDRCAFIGTKNNLLCDQDAIICGGPEQVEGAGAWTDGFQGYGTVISRNYFNHIRRAVYGRAFFNGSVIRDNTVWTEAGSNLAGGAAIEIDGRPTTGTQVAAGNVISNNLIEVPNYPYGIKLDHAAGNTIAGNNFYDPTATTLGMVRLELAATSNVIYQGFFDATKTGVSTPEPSNNTVLTPFATGGKSNYAWLTTFHRGLETNGLYSGGNGAPEIMLNALGGSGKPPGVYGVNSSTSPNGLVIANAGSLCFTQGGGADLNGNAIWVKTKDSTLTSGWTPVGNVTPLTTKTANYTLTGDDSVIVSNAATLTMTLPSAVTANVGRRYTIKNINASACTVGATAGTIDGAATASLAQWAKATYISDGTNWLSI